MGHVHRRLIAFDLDGTLVDSGQDLADSANDLIEELGGQRLSTEAVVAMVGDGAAVLVQRALRAAGLPEQAPGALPRFLAIYDTRLLNTTRLYPGIVDAVADARRHARVSVLTNKPLGLSERILDALGVRDLFDDVIGGDGPHPRKPDPTSLHALMARADASPAATLLVGDSRVDRDTAQRAGTRCCLLSYGFNFPDDPGRDGEWIVPDASALPGVFEQFVAGATRQG